MMKLTNSSFEQIDNMSLKLLVDLMVVNMLTNGTIKEKAYIEDLL